MAAEPKPDRGLEFVDLHYHANPDAYTRRHSVVEAGERYRRLGGAVVVRSHLGCTCAAAEVAQSLGLPVFGSVALNAIAGGIQASVIHRSLCHYQPRGMRLLVDFPTVVATQHRSKLARGWANAFVERYACGPASVLASDGGLLPALDEVLELAQSEPVVLSTGHASRRELELLVEACVKRGGIKLLLNQPANPITGMTAAALQALGRHDWLYIEQTALTVALGYQSRDDFFEVLSNVHNVVYSSDFGQLTQPDVEAWWAQSKAWFDCAQLSPARIADISLRTPLRLLAP